MPHFVSPEAVIEGDEPLPQAGVIAYRIRRGEVQVLLVTSRDTGRWIIPKGKRQARLNTVQSRGTGSLRGGGGEGDYRQLDPAREVYLFQATEIGRGTGHGS